MRVTAVFFSEVLPKLVVSDTAQFRAGYSRLKNEKVPVTGEGGEKSVAVFGVDLTAAKAWISFGILAVAAWMDIHKRKIPNSLLAASVGEIGRAHV